MKVLNKDLLMANLACNVICDNFYLQVDTDWNGYCSTLVERIRDQSFWERIFPPAKIKERHEIATEVRGRFKIFGLYVGDSDILDVRRCLPPNAPQQKWVDVFDYNVYCWIKILSDVDSLPIDKYLKDRIIEGYNKCVDQYKTD